MTGMGPNPDRKMDLQGKMSVCIFQGKVTQDFIGLNTNNKQIKNRIVSVKKKSTWDSFLLCVAPCDQQHTHKKHEGSGCHGDAW